MLFGLVCWHLPAELPAGEEELNARPVGATNIRIDNSQPLSSEAPANLVIFQPRESGQPTDNLLLISAEDSTGANAMSLRVHFTSEKLKGQYQIGESARQIELAVNHAGMTYLASSGQVSLHYDDQLLHGRIDNARMTPMQTDASAYTLSAVFEASVDLSCWSPRQDVEGNMGFRLDNNYQSRYCQSLSISEILPH